MNRVSFIIIIIVMWIIITGVKKAQGGGTNASRGNNSMPNTTVMPSNQGRGPANAYGYTGTNANGYTGTNAQTASTAQKKTARPAAAQKKSADDAVAEAIEDGNYTTAYLLEKARQDEEEHAREKYEEQMRLNKMRGGLRVAERLIDGDMPPRDKRCIVCGYCGAQNLLPMSPRERYSCYFCREPLD